MPLYVVGLGSNLGDRRAAIEAALEHLEGGVPGCRIEARSRLWETVPVGGPDGQPLYLNAAVRLRTREEPAVLLQRCHAIEQALGRNRSGEARWGPRTLDIDLLWWDGHPIRTASVTLPHPRLLERAFAVVPACEVLDHPPETLRRAAARAGEPGRAVSWSGRRDVERSADRR
ncbi:MAG: 2-amino-4-hydroxy-6-hydroxymethyldihydropteridine diphosphokinase [Myxococcota bacterium]|nr:2-amino-4-hydroxy-6-hydroxymethyldihydropteridine diphosphokinase [Myxococcota bacterium]MDW8362811.1 2-amino-4-hydroxy-6-hydroxymethyldihydropteridine diphosphokinase [Myxococcales bacterium]